MIAVDELMPDPSQPRKTFLDEEIQRLAASIAARGVQQPLRVIRDEQRQVWVILTGESRYRAAKLAGLTPCPACRWPVSFPKRTNWRIASPKTTFAMILSRWKRPVALARLKALKGCNSKALVEEYGFSGAAITKAEALLSLPEDIQELIGSGPGQIAPATGYEISRLPDEAKPAGTCPSDRCQASATRRGGGMRPEPVGKRNVAPKAGRLSCKLDGGISVTVSSARAADVGRPAYRSRPPRSRPRSSATTERRYPPLPALLRAS